MSFNELEMNCSSGGIVSHQGEVVICPMSKLSDICWLEALMLNDFLHICKVDKFKIYSEIKMRWKHAMGGSYI